MEWRRAITINRSRAELERAWHDFAYGLDWREQLLSTQLLALPHSRGTLVRLHLAEGAKTDDVELTLRMGQTHVHKYVKLLMGQIERGELDATFIITHRLPLEEAPAAYDLFANKKDGCVKVVLTP